MYGIDREKMKKSMKSMDDMQKKVYNEKSGIFEF